MLPAEGRPTRNATSERKERGYARGSERTQPKRRPASEGGGEGTAWQGREDAALSAGAEQQPVVGTMKAETSQLSASTEGTSVDF